MATRPILVEPSAPPPLPSATFPTTRRLWIAAAIVVTVLVLAVRACRPGAAVDPNLHTVAVRRGALLESVVATGKIQPKTKVDVKARVNGIVKQLPVDAGSAVSEGQIIAELDKEVAQARVKEARARLLSARAQAERMRVEVTSSDRDFTQRELLRQQQLKQTGIASSRELDKAKLDYELAQTKLDATRANLQGAEADVVSAEAVLEQAENELRYATILSPMTGLVLSRDVDVVAGVSAVGSSAGFGSPIMTIGDVSELHVVGQVDEVDIGKVQLGQQARIRVESFRGRVFPGEVTKIAPQGTEKEKVVNFEIEVVVRGDTAGLRPLMTADAEVIIAEKADALIIPEAAIIRDGEQTFVERPARHAKDGKERVPITLGIGNGADAEVATGLAEGDVIIGP